MDRKVSSNSMLSILFCFFLSVVFVACNKDDVIDAGAGKPVITLDNEYGVYSVKVGRTLTIAPEFSNVEANEIHWLMDGKVVCTGPEWTAQWDVQGEYYVTISAENEAGEAKEDIRVDVLDLTPPVISLRLPEGGLKVLPNTDYVFTPDIQHMDVGVFTIEWYIDGVKVSDELSCVFNRQDVGIYEVRVVARNDDGSAEKEFQIEVTDNLPYNVKFLPPTYMQTSTRRYTFPGRGVYLQPVVSDFTAPVYEWAVDGKSAGCAAQGYMFTPENPGLYRISVSVSEKRQTSASTSITRNVTAGGGVTTAVVEVECVDASEASRMRTPASSPMSNKVYEWIPAPGQFINQKSMGGAENDYASACKWAETRLAEGLDVSLGAFGGYIIVGFDHSIRKTSGYDFIVESNAFVDEAGRQGSNEPGIVWVMQDVNGNGLPDDEWYELKGSESDEKSTVRGYAVTYYRPASPAMNVSWTDNMGGSGEIDYLKTFHNQDYYYPAWIEADTYTLYGTKIKSKNYYDSELGIWNNPPYAWGYVDNVGSDAVENVAGQGTGFRISNAVYPDGTPAVLEYIDFIKVQVAVQAKSGIIGELSTEVLGFKDCSIAL